VVDELAARNRWKWRRSRRLDAEFTEGEIGGIECLLLRPTTYMNASGEAVAPLVRGEKLDIASDLLVIVDDIALPFGQLRLRAKGSSGGHRGLESVIGHLGSREFARLRCGIGLGERVKDLASHVLASWPRSVRRDVEAMIARAADAVEKWATTGIVEAMSLYNVRDRKDPRQ
jgi:PTH1 family peptidyl-tRNA hydrolase